ncbi:NosD domain-containing protein [Mangrovicoccus ximenensis]|uniref:NosD domain-containing protein n=1 Tax=Mangrovicoccus ximenensis TaxID=1911570 RepID=UPI0013750BF0|nr:NosD domain-containing protein [Mangrovicoccus ximenensis]
MSDLSFVGHIPTEEEGADPDAADTTRSDAIAGYGHQQGLRVHNSENVSLEDATFRDLRLAVYVGESTDVDLTGLTIEEVREGINFYETQRLAISDSLFRDFNPWLSMDDETYDTRIHDHSDMIQYWGANSVLGVHDITISGNTFIAAPGSTTQTIFGHLKSGPDGVTASNFTVTDNLIINGQTHGISLGDVDGAVIANNVLLPNTYSDLSIRQPAIRAPDSTNLVVENNTVVDGYGVYNSSDAVLVEGNIVLNGNTILSSVPTDESYWKLLGAEDVLPLSLWAEANGMAVVTGTAGDDVISAAPQGSLLEGGAGDDILHGGAGDDIMIGGDGADQFHFDLRGTEEQGNDLILDLDVGEGDEIHLTTGTSGLFAAAAGDGSGPEVLLDGSAVIIDSLEDLQDIVASGAMTHQGGGVLALAGGSGYTLQLGGIDPADLEVPIPVEDSPAIEDGGSAEEEPAPAPVSPPPIYAGGDMVTGTDAGETLWASSGGSLIDAGGGNDTLAGRAGADTFFGGEGADRFIFDLRLSNAEDDMILDLDFSEGDEIFVVTNIDGLFTNDADPDNNLWIGGNGSSAKIRSEADLQEVVASGAMDFVSDGMGGGALSLADGSGYTLYIWGGGFV